MWPCLSVHPSSNTDFWLVCFVALHPKSTAIVLAIVMAGRSIHLTTLLPGQAWTSSWPIWCAHTFHCNLQQPFLNDSAEGRRMTIEIISRSSSTKVCDRAGIELATPGSAVKTHICCQTLYWLRYASRYWLVSEWYKCALFCKCSGFLLGTTCICFVGYFSNIKNTQQYPNVRLSIDMSVFLCGH